jgi:adenosine deaminase
LKKQSPPEKARNAAGEGINSIKNPTRPIEFYRSLPKVELHRHLEGSLRFETVRELVQAYGLEVPSTTHLRGLVQVGENEPLTFENFLSKFATLRLLYRSPEIISRITIEAIADAAADNVRYLELRFTPVALGKSQGFSLAQVMDWVIEAAHQGEKEHGVTTRLIASVNRHEGVDLAAQVSHLAAGRKDQGIVGLDLAGYEPGFPAGPFAAAFRAAQEVGLHVTIHAGEWDRGENVAEAIHEVGARRIGHGIRLLETPEVLELARQNDIPFEVCLTSNHRSGAVEQLKNHPVRGMLAEGLNVTLNTDDPSVFGITLSDEYRLFCETLGFPLETLQQCVLAAARASFLPEPEREALVQALEREYRTLPNAL